MNMTEELIQLNKDLENTFSENFKKFNSLVETLNTSDGKDVKKFFRDIDDCYKVITDREKIINTIYKDVNDMIKVNLNKINELKSFITNEISNFNKTTTIEDKPKKSIKKSWGEMIEEEERQEQQRQDEEKPFTLVTRKKYSQALGGIKTNNGISIETISLCGFNITMNTTQSIEDLISLKKNVIPLTLYYSKKEQMVVFPLFTQTSSLYVIANVFEFEYGKKVDGIYVHSPLRVCKYGDKCENTDCMFIHIPPFTSIESKMDYTSKPIPAEPFIPFNRRYGDLVHLKEVIDNNTKINLAEIYIMLQRYISALLYTAVISEYGLIN